MRKLISIWQKPDGSRLYIYETKAENLVGEVYKAGVYGRGKWSQKATFYRKDGDATEYRVKEYFGFSDATQIHRYRIWSDSESGIAISNKEYNKVYENLEEACSKAGELAHKHDGKFYKVIFHVEDLTIDETVDTYENIN